MVADLAQRLIVVENKVKHSEEVDNFRVQSVKVVLTITPIILGIATFILLVTR